MSELDTIDEKYHEDSDDAGNALQSELWLQLWGYARRYPMDLTWLGACAISTAAMEICYPLITRSVVDTVAVEGYHSIPDSLIWHYALLYALTTLVITVSIGGFIRFGGKLETRISYDIRESTSFVV